MHLHIFAFSYAIYTSEFAHGKDESEVHLTWNRLSNTGGGAGAGASGEGEGTMYIAYANAY